MSKRDPKPETRNPILSVLLVCIVLAGCATFEFSHAPEAPAVRALARPTQEEHPSPPALKTPSPVTEAKKTEVPTPAPQPLKLTVEFAIDMALENNQALKVEKVDPEVARTLIAQQRAAFDPTVAANYGYTRGRIEHDLDVATHVPLPATASAAATTRLTNLGAVDSRVETGATTTTNSATVGVSEFLPTGTTVSANLMPSWTRIDNFSSSSDVGQGNDTHGRATTAELSLTQHLLKGSRLKVNLASLREARLAAFSTDYGLRVSVEALVAQVESTYWDYCLALQQIRILEDSLKVAEAQAAEAGERIRIGTLAESEQAPAAAEVALRRSQLIDGKSSAAQLRLTLLRLLNPSETALQNQEVTLASEPVVPEIPLDTVDESLVFAQRMRPEVNQARLQIQQDDLEMVKAKDGLLPQLDAVVALSKDVTHTEYDDPLLVSTKDVKDDAYQINVGAQFSYPIGNRAARAGFQQAGLTLDKDKDALKDASQQVEKDVRGAYVELSRAHEQLSATAASRRAQEVVAQTELEKFRVGTSTALLVSQAQRDLLQAQINEVQAVKNFLQAVVALYKADGSLLLRRGIECPGAVPVELDRPPKKQSS